MMNAVDDRADFETIFWSGAMWAVKASSNATGPGPNLFVRSNVSVDVAGKLHLTITKNARGQWTCAEIVGLTTYGYGTYTFALASRLDTLDPNVVVGLSTWSDEKAFANREIDIEFARWGHAADPTNAQYVVQPHAVARHLVRFTQPDDAVSRHRFTWQHLQVKWSSIGAAGNVISSYEYSGADVPVTGDERVHLKSG